MPNESDEQQMKLLERVGANNGFGSQREAQRFLQEEFNVCYTQGGVWLLFGRLKIKAKEPRPVNKKAAAESAEEQAAYKKTFSAG